MSQRLQIVLPDPVATQLQELAASAGEPLATLAGRIVRDGIARAAKDHKITASAAPARKAATLDRRPPWLEPYGGDPAWWREMWGSVVALHGRDPRPLEHLKDGWWEDEATAETACALAVWRAEIDHHGRDPREEFAFHHQLADIAGTLRQQGGGVENRWTPGAPPERWDG
jgi:hypothetical protein